MFQLTQEDITEYQKIMNDDYGLQMSNKQAKEHGVWLLGLCESLFINQDKNGSSNK